MEIQLTCNTAAAELLANIAASSARPLAWVKSLPAHDGHAVIVGGGPSLADNLGSIRKRIEHGQTVFALNGSAAFLNRHEIVPDYQVILDARPENVALKARAHEHLIASQCHPSMFDGLKRVTLWHANLDDIEDHLPIPRPAYALISGGPTVGLSAMNLAYALGYRSLHLYGYDSSHRNGDAHAYDQPAMLRDPICQVTLGGETFTSTLSMARQAERFPSVCDDLIALGCVITNDSEGLIMAAMRASQAPEVLAEDEKYRRMWAHDAYRAVSPGEQEAERFVTAAQITPDLHVIDFGCGSGRGGKRVHELTGARVTQVDFAENARDAGNDLPFVLADLTQPMSVTGDVGYCTDVMEHIPPHDVPAVIANIMACVDRCWFKIALFHDNMGALIGHPLHLSVFPPAWWEKAFEGYRIVHWAVEPGDFPYATFHVENLKQGA